MNIQKLTNPKSELYSKFKTFALSSEFAWYWHNSSTYKEYDETKYYDIPFLSHNFLRSPATHSKGIKISEVNSEYVQIAANLFLEILAHNNIAVNAFFRINANCVLPLSKTISTVPHVDHMFPHKNVLIYLTSAGGRIIVGEDLFDPKEDDVILFEGLEHHHEVPKVTATYNRRIALVATFF